MKEIVLTGKIEKKLKTIGNGSEGVVYKYNDKAYKIFFTGKNKTLTINKIEKIKLLNQLNIENIITPQELIIDKLGCPIGYTMNYIDAKIDMYELTRGETYTLTDKINELKKLEKIMKEAHNCNITIGDMSLFNFLKDKNDNIVAIDTDNYKIQGYTNDILPSIGHPYYEGKISNIVDSNLDKFLFGLYAIRNLIKPSKNRKLQFCDGAVIGYSDDNEYLEYLVDALLVDKEFKKELLDLFSEKKEKKYIAESLDYMVSKKYMNNKSFIEVNENKMKML